MIVANITVYKCDDCDEYLSISTMEDFGDFQAAWFTSLTKDFCTSCKDKIENLSAIEIATEIDQSAFDRVHELAATEEVQHVS